MKFSPKLKNAMKEIEAILNKYDIAGVVTLHNPGNTEYLLKVNPSYSCASLVDGGIRFKAKLKEDFNGDKKKWEEAIANTSNMMALMAETMGHNTLAIISVSEQFDKVVNAEHGKTSHTSEEEIEN